MQWGYPKGACSSAGVALPRSPYDAFLEGDSAWSRGKIRLVGHERGRRRVGPCEGVRWCARNPHLGINDAGVALCRRGAADERKNRQGRGSGALTPSFDPYRCRIQRCASRVVWHPNQSCHHLDRHRWLHDRHVDPDVSLRPGGDSLSDGRREREWESHVFARFMLGLDRSPQGSSHYADSDIQGLRGAKLQEFLRGVHAVFRDPYGIYNPFYPVDRVLWQAVRRFGVANSTAERGELIRDALRAVDLRTDDVQGRYPHQLSVGERQRLMLVRVYGIRLRIIVADDPVSMMDTALRVIFTNIPPDFQKQGAPCLFSTHIRHNTHYLGGDAMVLYQCQVLEPASADQILPARRRPYTKAVVRSVLHPDPDARWTSPVPAKSVESGKRTVVGRGCPFWQRCEHVMDRCRVGVPLRPVSHGSVVACFFDGDQAPGLRWLRVVGATGKEESRTEGISPTGDRSGVA